jgi:hypothetical protein
MTISKPVHLDHRLLEESAVEQAGGALGEAGQAGGDRGELVGHRPVQPVGDRDRQPVGRDDHRVGDPWGLLLEVADEPGEVAGFVAELRHRQSWGGAVEPFRKGRRPAGPDAGRRSCGRLCGRLSPGSIGPTWSGSTTSSLGMASRLRLTACVPPTGRS